MYIINHLYKKQLQPVNPVSKVKLTISGRFCVLEWQTVTVAWFHFNRSAIGDPTILLRPRTTAFLPAKDTPKHKIKNF